MLHILRSIADMLLPRTCIICNRRLSLTEDGMCAACSLTLATEYVSMCVEHKLLWAFVSIIPVEKAEAVTIYVPRGPLSRPLHMLKYHQAGDIGVFFGRIAAMKLLQSGVFDGVDVVVPMPITRKRLALRGFNQSQLIAEGISSITGIPVVKDAVRRKHFTVSQTRLGRWQRAANVRDAFALHNPAALSGKHLLLVDDVITTGSTMSSCAMEIMKAGGVRFSMLSVLLSEGDNPRAMPVDYGDNPT